MIAVTLLGTNLTRPALALAAGTRPSGSPLGHAPLTTGGCLPPQAVPPSVQQSLHYQEALWWFSLHTYPSCRIPPGALQRASAQLQQVPASRQITPGIRSPMPTRPLGDGTGETAWAPIGPVGINDGGVDSGRVMTVAVDPSHTQTVYLGAAGGGVWKTTNGGTNWSPLTSNQASESMGALAIDPTNDNVIYAGTGEGDYALDSVTGDGILKSTDAGSTWTDLGTSTFSGDSINKVVVDPVTPNKIWVQSTPNGVYVSSDGGTTWSNASLSGLPQTTGWDLVLDPANHNTIYASVGEFSDSRNGIYKSTDGGNTWALLANAPNEKSGTPGYSPYIGRMQLAVTHPSGSTVLYAAVANNTSCGLLGIYRSTDGGSTWTALTNADPAGPNAGCQYWYDFALNADPSDSTGKTLWLAGIDIFKTVDGGSSWVNETQVYGGNAKGVHPDQHAFAFAGTTMYVGNDGGVYATPDGGTTFAEKNDTLAITQFYSGAIDASTTPKVIGGAQDNGTDLWSGNGGNLRWNEIFGGDGGDTAVDYTAPQTYYEEYTNLQMNKSTDGGQTWAAITNGITDLSNACFIAPFRLGPNNPQELLAGTREVYETTNGGASWSSKSPDLTSAGGCVVSLAIAPSNDQTWYAGTTNGLTWTTSNGGSSWHNISAGLPGASVTSIVVDPISPQVAYVTEGNCFSGGCVWRTADGGTTWKDITSNLPHSPANSVLVDPLDSNHLYLANDQSVFESYDDGSTWTTLGNGLPTVAGDQLFLNHAGTVLTVATHGRGMYQLFRSWLQLSATSGPVGSSLTVTGYGFLAGETVTAAFNGVSEGSAPANSNGTASVTFNVPNLPAGSYTVSMQGGTSGRTATASFTVQSSSYSPADMWASSASSTQQYTLTNSDGSTWTDIDPNALVLTLNPASNTNAVISGNADLWTSLAGYNQDFGIWVSGGSYGSGQVVSWKESGGFAGTFSPNAAYVQAVLSLQGGTTYTVKLQWKANKADPGTIWAGAGPISGQFSPTRLTAEMAHTTSSATISSVASTQQYTLQGSDGSTWMDMDSTNLVLSLTPTTSVNALLSGNADLWTSQTGYNQDLGIWISGGAYGSGQIVAWKESGGFAGTFSPNAALVHTAVTLQAGVTYSVRLRWKANKADSGTIWAGAGPIGGRFSPTRLTAELVPTTSTAVSSGVSAQQYTLTGSDGISWTNMDASTLQLAVTPTANGSAVVSANADLWTSLAGYNQDIGIWISGGAYGSGQIVAWKESGGFAGTFSPNAAFVQTVLPLQSGTTYTITLRWKANKLDPGTIWAGAGPINGQFSPSRLTLLLLRSSES